MFNKVYKLLSAALSVAILAGCASGVKRMDGGSTASATKYIVSSVNLSLSPAAKALVMDNAKFNADELKINIERLLRSQDLVAPNAPQTLFVEITGFRTRSTFSAIMFGFMAGNDNIEGVVTIKDASGRELKKAQVSASYALGGIAGGGDTRMSWLYEEFAKHTVAEVSGAVAK
jgi:Domain of unknown function (DUF4410)